MVLLVISDVQIVLDLQVKQIGNKDFFFFFLQAEILLTLCYKYNPLFFSPLEIIFVSLYQNQTLYLLFEII